MTLGVVKQSFFGLPGQYGRHVTRANGLMEGTVFDSLTHELLRHPRTSPVDDLNRLALDRVKSFNTHSQESMGYDFNTQLYSKKLCYFIYISYKSATIDS